MKDTDNFSLARGDAVEVIAGRLAGQTGTVVRANGSSTKVALHADGYIAFRGYDGRHYVAPADAVQPAVVVNPRTSRVIHR